jgi:NAD+ diphosphatase
MIGFIADYAGGELAPEPGEIEDAGWYGADELPEIPVRVPARVSIARAMIDDFVRRHGIDAEDLKTPQ